MIIFFNKLIFDLDMKKCMSAVVLVGCLLSFCAKVVGVTSSGSFLVYFFYNFVLIALFTVFTKLQCQEISFFLLFINYK